MTDPVDLISQVRAVTVYRRGAMITRAAELVRETDGFPTRLQLVGLPLSLDDSSVRVEVEALDVIGGAGQAPIAGDLRVTLSVPGQDSELAPPSNDMLDQATLELALIRSTLEQLVRAEARLTKLQPIARGRPEEGKPPATSPTAARLELLSFRRERAEQLGERIRAERDRERKARERLAHLREQQRLASTQRNTRTYELRKAAILELDRCVGPGLADKLRINLHYFVPGARWAPAYTVRLDGSMRSASLELRALVGQSTGEDWRGVALTLSTATPQQWTELPKLESQRIGRKQPPPAKTGWRPPPVGADELYADFDRGLGQPLASPEPSPVDLVEQPAATPKVTEFERLLREEAEARAREEAVRMQVYEEQARRQSMHPGPPMPPPAGGAVPPGMPMPMMESEMMPQAMAPEMKRSRGSVVGAIVGGVVGGAVGAVGAVASAFGGSADEGPTRSRSMSPGSFDDFKPHEQLELAEPELIAGRELLDYGRLRLYDASHSQRGSLRRITTRVLYQQLSVESFAIDLAIEQIDNALSVARSLERESAPERHRWPTSEGGFDYAYVADAPSDLASDGQFHSLVIDLREAEATPRYIAIPRETQDVFRIVALRNPLAAPLLPGPADVYVAGKFALTSDVELTPIAGRIELGLGVEQAIKIARNVSFSEDSSGMFKRHLELRHGIAIEIANHLGSAATVEVRERIPIAAEAQADDIEVEIKKVEPSWEDYEPDDPPLEGGRRWIVEVPANQKRELEACWVVTIPSNHELVGGNRREV
jgi:hypothetical protein